jgi:ketosteroid isomerase-like protein
MSQANVEAFKRALDAGTRGDFEALLKEVDPQLEWHPALATLVGGEATVYRGREGARAALRDLSEAFAELHLEISEIRDLDDRIVAIGHMRGRGTTSGAEIESPWAYVVQFNSGKAIRVRAYLNPKEALEAAGLSQ